MTNADERRISVVLVNYRKATRVIENIAALRRQSVAALLDIVVVDNSCDPAEASLLHEALGSGDAQLIIAPRNLGYTRGVNLGARAAPPGGHVLLLNPDIVVDDADALASLTSVLESDPAIGIVGTLQRNDDDSLVEVARRFPNLPRLVLRRLVRGALTDHDLMAPLLETPEGPPLDVDWVQSSFTLVRDRLWATLGGLDELYEIFMSDVALGAAAHRRGYRVVITGQVTVRADGLRASSGGIRSLFSSRALRVHVLDAIKYQAVALFRPARIRAAPR